MNSFGIFLCACVVSAVDIYNVLAFYPADKIICFSVTNQYIDMQRSKYLQWMQHDTM